MSNPINQRELSRLFPGASKSTLARNNVSLPTESVSTARVVPAAIRPKTTPLALDGSAGISTDEAKLNKTEKRFLESLRRRGYSFVGIQCLTFKIGFDCRYSPDFVTVDSAGRITCWEVKGAFVFEKALYKPRAAANKFLFVRFMTAQWKNGQWTEKMIKP